MCQHFLEDPQHLPLSALMSVLLFRFNRSSPKKDFKLMTEIFKFLSAAFTNKSPVFDFDEINRLNFLTLTYISNTIQYFNLESFKLSIKLLSQGLLYFDSNSTDPLLISTEDLSKFFNSVKLWNSRNIIKDKMTYKDYLSEVNFWEDFLKKYTFPKLISLLHLIEEFLVDRFKSSEIRDQYIIDIFLQLHKENNYSNVLEEVFLKELTSRLHAIAPGEKSTFINQLYDQLSDPGQLERVINIFSKILLDERRVFEENQILHLFTWTTWETYFGLLNFNISEEVISKDAKNMLDSALEQFKLLCSDINTLTITFNIMKLISQKKKYFLNLTKINSKIVNNKHIEQNLDACLNRYNWILDQRNLLKLLHDFLENFPNINNATVSDFLAIDFEVKSLSDICIPKGTSFSFSPNSIQINEIVGFPNLKSLCQVCDSLRNSKIILKIFNRFIDEKVITLHTPLEIQVFFEEIWEPAWDSCIQILQQLSDESIIISDMCEYFDSSQDIFMIKAELNQLEAGCKNYRSDSRKVKHLNSCADKILLYFNLQQCSEAAILINKLKDALSIKMEYDTIKNLENSKDTFYNEELSKVNDKVGGIKADLSNLTKSNLDVLEAFIDRISFVKWIRDNLNDLNELKTFVDISLTTCGGNPVDIDRITCLSSVCTNFAPLIFRIKEKTKYKTLIARCKEVIRNVENNNDLTKLLRQVGKSVTFWEEMKRSHGSVEETTLMQLNSIFNSGKFCLKVGESLNLCDIVSLSVEREEYDNRIYKLEQLNDFRSKVMLVVSKFEQNTQTDSYDNSQLFTHKFDLISEIATIVIQLIETGCQSLHNYELTSNVAEDVRTLLEERSILSNKLKNWRQNLEEARDKHYFLNYYTISQLVSLQKGIVSFTSDREDSDLEQLYHLLGLINQEVTMEEIQQALKVIGINCNDRSKRIHLESSSKSKQHFSSQSLHSVIRNKHPHKYPAHSMDTTVSRSFIQTIQDEIEFPNTFSLTEKEIAESVSKGGDISLNLTIKGIIELKKDQNPIISGESLLDWCILNETFGDVNPNFEVLNSDTDVVKISTCTEIPSNESNTDFHQLGLFLDNIYLSCKTKIRAKRELPFCNMKSGTPNLVVVPPLDLFEFVLSLYVSENDKLPLPFYHEVLICTTHTKLEEIEIFWRRSMKIPDNKNMYLFCMIGIENLDYDVAVQAVTKFKFIQQKLKSTEGYKLVLVCSEEKEEYSYMAAAFEQYKIPILTTICSDDVKRFMTQRLSFLPRYNTLNGRAAWEVDKGRYRVRLVVSDSVGAGKSLYIYNLKSDMLNMRVVSNEEIEHAAVTVAIHGKEASEDNLAEQLLKSRICKLEHGVMFHIDVASTVQLNLEPIFFKLLLLGSICKRSGELWHCRSTDYYVIEMTLASGLGETLQFTNLYPKVHCLQPYEALYTQVDSKKQTIDLEELTCEKYQRVNAYLQQLEISQEFGNFTFNPSETFHRVDLLNALRIFLKFCGVSRPSWAEVRNFITFLDKQLSDCDNSDYCNGVMAQEWRGFKNFVVKFMINMSRDFATPSLKSDSEQNSHNPLTKFEIAERRRWENNSHPYIFFHPDRHTMTFLGFHISNQGDLIDFDDPTVVIERNIMQPGLVQILTANRVDLKENYHRLDKIEKIMKIAGVMDIDLIADPDPGYVLTLDNMRKILAILMRFRCNIPVVVMGETGCGKTRLIQFMCSLQALQYGTKNMLILKVHGGTTELDVIQMVEEAENLAKKNFSEHKIDTVLFFDEANTSPAIGLIKEIMCDRRMYGRHISSNIGLQFIAACNPYRKHTKEMLNKLSCAGLGFFTKASQTMDRLVNIPLRELVYRVMDLPASLGPLVWDFGQLSRKIEKTYTMEIIMKHLKSSSIEFPYDVVKMICEVLAGAQNYMRKRKDECSFVSLRDVERAMRVMIWFYSNLHHFQSSSDMDNSQLDEYQQSIKYVNVIDPKINGIDHVTYSLILSLAVCYRARLQERKQFDKTIIKLFTSPLTEFNNYTIIHQEVDRCQRLILEEMSVGANIAHNKALKENVFMMFVCIELKIPLFVIGKPGSSKSLAKSIISNSMQGSRSPDGSILQNFKQIQIMSYQCSQLSTADGIIGVFKSCRSLQRKTGSNKFAACVVLDEVGLAEDSPLLPLKVLHPLLEDNSYGSEEIENELNESDLLSMEMNVMREETRSAKDDVDDTKDRVAFIGISNWSLDPAKMNRGIMVSRGDPDLDELVDSARGICQSKRDTGPINKSIEKRIKHLANAYHKLTSKMVSEKSREYFGLRDFYSLIKMLVFICHDANTTLNRTILQHAVKRNFGGVSDVDPVKVFEETVKLPKGDNEKGPNSSLLGLISANLTNLSRSFHGETRYLLLLTENYAALNILLHSPDMWPKKEYAEDIRVIFGSSFPCDQEYSVVCRNINRIKVCMETGKTIILLNLENLYESLYDALNQYYMEMNNQRYVDLGLGTHRMKCRVHNDFKLIVVADKETVQERFPTPLINRLEKHFLTMATVLSKEGVCISELLSNWAKDFATLDDSHFLAFQRRCDFSEGDCFIGFHNDTPSSIVFHVMKEMYPDVEDNDRSVDRVAVLERSQTMLLKMATTDAVLRVENSHLSFISERITTEYFKLQQSSLEEYLRHILDDIYGNETGAHLTLATTHSRLLTDRDIGQLRDRLSSGRECIDISSLSLQQFQSEQQYTREIHEFLSRSPELNNRKILLIQCEKGADNAKLIACARHKTVDELKDWKEEKSQFRFEVCLIFLIQLCREAHGSKFVSFCGGPWNTVHIDDIRSLDYTELPPISDLNGKQIYELFGGDQMETESPLYALCPKAKLKNCIQPAASRLDDSNGSEERIVGRIRDILLLTDNNNDFVTILCQRLTNLLKERHDSTYETNIDWLRQTANCGEDIQSSGTFRKAVNLRINNAIIPLLAELIAVMDRNGNLELALNNQDVPVSLVNLWYDIFRDDLLLVLKYKDIMSLNTLQPRIRVPVLNDGASGNYFTAHFPFSWLVNQCASDVLSQTKNLAGTCPDGFWMRFESLFSNTPLGQMIINNLLINDDNSQLFQHYLRDFIFMSIYPRDLNQFEVYEFVILNCIRNYIPIDGMEEDPSNYYDDKLSIPKIHCAYEDSKQLLDLLKQAFSYDERLAAKLNAVIAVLKEKRDKKLQCLELVLLEEIITVCSHKAECTASNKLAEKYVSDIIQWQSVIERGLSFNQLDNSSEELRLSIRYKWNRIVAVQLFISHCSLGDEFHVTETSISRLYMVLGECPDFASAEVITRVLSILSNCLKRMSQKSSEIQSIFKNHATRFFIRILTDLTFKYLRKGDKNSDLIKLLMGFVSLDEKNSRILNSDTGNINIFTKEGLDPSPAFRTFLLQLLIKHRQDVFKEHITDYLRDTVSTYTDNLLKRDLFLLIIQSIEDSLYQQYKQESNLLEFMHYQIRNVTIRYLANDTISYEWLEKIATLRFMCMHTSHWIIECYDLLSTHDNIQLQNYVLVERLRLINMFKDICLLEGYEDLHIFLLKNIYHQLGSDTLHVITRCSECVWIIPEHVMHKMSQLPAIIPDYFIIYGEDYLRITSAVEQVNLLQSKHAFSQFFNSETKPDPSLTECLIYSIFQEVTKYFKNQDPKDSQSLDQVLLTVKKFINTGPLHMTSELKDLAIQITTNNFGDGHLRNLELKHNSNNHELFLIRLIFHGAVMLSCGKYHKLFQPIALLYSNPQSLRGRLFPTMMDDQFIYTKSSMTETGQWYQCPKGHPYFIGDCGRPSVTDICPDCRSAIGGAGYMLEARNTTVDIARDETKSGYLLRRVNNDKKDVTSGERSLDPAAVKIIRILMDISFIWSSCSKHSRIQVLLSLVNRIDESTLLPTFFYQHLEKDIKDLAVLIGQNFEEATFLIHLIVKLLMQTARETCKIPTKLTGRELRDQWEKEFDKKFIRPVLSSLHTDVHRQMEQVLSEKRIANNPLLRIVYEREEPEPNNILPHLWRYRTIVSLEHFSQSFSTADINTKHNCPLVDKFLREERKLFVTRYLPDIVHLQRKVRDRLLHRLDRREATATTIKDFLTKISISDKKESEELGKLIESMATAWSMIGEDVRNNGRLRMDEALKQEEITPATSLAYLLPSSTAEGVLITSLTDYLVLIHNSFVHTYIDRVNGSRSGKIALHQLDASHVIEYDDYLQPMLLAHSHYSLALGQGSHVKYDFEGVEKQFMDQFIQSKPLIMAEHLRFEYTREAYCLDVFEQVRHKVKQTEVKEMLWRAILEDLDSLEVVSDVLRVLDVVIGILSSAGGDSEQKLSSYLYDVLKYSPVSHGAGPLQSRRAEAVLYLKHIISFWNLLSIEKARKLSILGQIPFSSLSDEFQEDLSMEDKMQIELCCEKFSVEKVLTYLHEFILFFVREKGPDQRNYGLKESIIIEAEEKGSKLPEGFSHFPDRIKLSQCAAFWAVLARKEFLLL
ncbi:E3 ubiquitin-protein ligase [Oopsacas minuta]|uniref:E3 ubiquitin-protein ligase n=1 Tax=Oopsacas minuta TaxID=111878 RepID=A0AAV7JUM4_9METZ|nr:E3 ubiquitin-protein ligase [Oopsacas minuta]